MAGRRGNSEDRHALVPGPREHVYTVREATNDIVRIKMAIPSQGHPFFLHSATGGADVRLASPCLLLFLLLLLSFSFFFLFLLLLPSSSSSSSLPSLLPSPPPLS